MKRGVNKQQGVTLITGLIFLVALSLLGVISMKSALMQERMAGSTRDYNLAFQAAEAALRDAKRDIIGIKSDGTDCVFGTTGCRAVNHLGVPGSTEYTTTCTDGLCSSPCNAYTFGAGPHIAYPLESGNGVEYGTYTAAPAIPGVAAKPRYLIEYFVRGNNKNAGLCVIDPSNVLPVYRIVARGVGANPNTVVVLQEVFIP